ncbi:MAG TPA: GNAT family N-acetyltransferase [Aggregatilineales bacterium]|nr:GNAT family N-acetyltransferase [Anaerolineales bacterium]HRE48948.1 GNAT family N-acetyltransferase [Aggregatilineales bacterium]
MHFRFHDHAEAFLASAGEALGRAEALNNLMIGLALRIHEQGGQMKHKPYMATVTEGDSLTAAIMTPPFNVTLYSDAPDPVPAMVRIADDLHANGWEVSGVSGRPPLAERFGGLWREQTGITPRKGLEMGIYELRVVTPPPNAPAGRLAVATPSDIDLVTEWAVGFERDALHQAEPNRTELRQMCERRLAGGDIYLWHVEGDAAPVSMAAQGRKTFSGVVVNFVFTPPELRGKGYASAAVAALSQHFLDNGHAFCALFTDMANPTSNSIYQKIGYRYIGAFEEWLFKVEGH